MGHTLSPLRYPGGKTRLAHFVKMLIQQNGLSNCAYIEPFAGGAGIAWALLFGGHISSVYLNDLDPAIYAFWRSVFDHTDELCSAILQKQVSMSTWKKQRAILKDPSSYSIPELGFAAFFLNRTNRSGIIQGGVIGGQGQTGKWKLDARFNKRALITRIQKIAAFAGRVSVYHLNAAEFLRTIVPSCPMRSLVFLDPPYFGRGRCLYYSNFTPSLHDCLANLITDTIRQPWIVSYDNVPEVRRLYSGMTSRTYRLSYSAADRYVGSEVLFFSHGLNPPNTEILQPAASTRRRAKALITLP